MTPLLTAIQSKFTSTSTITSVVTGGLHLSEAAEGTSLPFAELDVVYANTDTRFGVSQRPYDCEIQFKVYADSAANAMADIALITAAFDDVELSLGTGKQFFVNRTSEPYCFRSTEDEHVQRGSDVNPIYCAIVTYQYACHG